MKNAILAAIVILMGLAGIGCLAQLDFSRVSPKVIVSLIDHIELVIKKAMVPTK